MESSPQPPVQLTGIYRYVAVLTIFESALLTCIYSEASEPRRSQQTDPSVANLPVEPSTTGGLLAPPLQLHEIRPSETSLLSSASGGEESAHSEQERDNSASILDSEEQAQPTAPECEESGRTRAFIETMPVRENKATGRDLWREAFETLPESTQAKLHTNGVQAVAPLQKQIHDLLETTKARQKECEEKFWKFRVGNHEYVLRDYAVRIADCLQVIGNTAIKFAPPQASGPWVVIEALLKVYLLFCLFLNGKATHFILCVVDQLRLSPSPFRQLPQSLHRCAHC